MRFAYAAVLLSCLFNRIAGGGQISFGGVISQSTQNDTGPAVNNPALNIIADGDAYTVTINFIGSVSTLGAHPLAGVSMTFADTTQSATETAFAPPTSASCASFPTICVVVSTDGAFDNISVLACLPTGSGCAVSNQLDANFQVPVAGLTGSSISAQGIAGLTPLDLLEGDGTTDIQGSVTRWSNNRAASTVPEPSVLALLGSTLVPLAWFWKKRRNQ